MINFSPAGEVIQWPDDLVTANAILFDEEGKEKMKLVLRRALNTLSPPDAELIALLDALEDL